MKKILLSSVISIFTIVGIVVLLNIDIFFRAFNNYESGTFSLTRFRLDLASYNIGRAVPSIPDNAKTSSVDGMVQVFIPEGEFFMGIGQEGNSPEHLLYLDDFWMDRLEVTNAMYRKCVSDGGCGLPVSVNFTYDKWMYRNHPMVYITWYQAEEYCEWAGRRLPSEAEWEKAARGTDKRPYPWGYNNPNPRLANYDISLIEEAVPVTRYRLGLSPYGVLNMAGNVREWVADWFAPDYYHISDYANPQGPETGENRVLRGGSYSDGDLEITVHRRYQHEPDSPGLNRGFRCAQDP